MSCRNQKFGHSFAGGVCLNEGCGISQQELSYGVPKKEESPFKLKMREKVRGANSKEQSLAIDIVTELGDKKKGAVGIWIGRIKQKGYQRVFEAFTIVSKMPEIDNRCAYLNGMLKNK